MMSTTNASTAGASTSSAGANDTVTLRRPTVADGPAIWTLVRDSGALDLNSVYCYLVLCRDFPHAAMVAERDGKYLGFEVGYTPPGRDDVLFVWQIGVDAAARGMGLAGRLLDALVTQADVPVRWLETTVTPSNQPSDALFRSFARRHGAGITTQEVFAAELFPGGGHEPEILYRIGPLSPTDAAKEA